MQNLVSTAPVSAGNPRGLGWGAGLLGFALAGFFDGVLLHQVLQWHHLLSAVQRDGLADLRMQVMADGLFHLAMYLIGLAGLVLLWRERAALGGGRTGALLLSRAAIGFGLWHVVDGVLSHWLLGLHRIRMDSPRPLLWDLLWFAVFGLGFLALGRWLARRPLGLPGGAVASVLVGGTVVASVAATWPAQQPGLAVVLRQDAQPAALMSVVMRSDARVAWTDGRVWLLRAGTDGALPSAMDLWRGGAAWVAGPGALPAGCSSALQVSGKTL